MSKLQNQESSEVTENNQDFYYFYQSSTGENLFMHNMCIKLFHQQFDQDYSKYPFEIEAQILEIDNDQFHK